MKRFKKEEVEVEMALLLMLVIVGWLVNRVIYCQRSPSRTGTRALFVTTSNGRNSSNSCVLVVIQIPLPLPDGEPSKNSQKTDMFMWY